ncbi:MAG: hypothetical protein ACYC91_11205 [Solirubrobacteraceae bacterium]
MPAPSRQPEEDRSACTPCRGTGRLISGFGGTSHEVECAWCGGSGRFDPARDAQQAGPADPAGRT